MIYVLRGTAAYDLQSVGVARWRPRSPRLAPPRRAKGRVVVVSDPQEYADALGLPVCVACLVRAADCPCPGEAPKHHKRWPTAVRPRVLTEAERERLTNGDWRRRR